MGLLAKSTGKQMDPIPEGVTMAACFAIYDMGTQFDAKWNKSKREVLFMWEVPEHRIDIEKDGVQKNLPRAISQTYTLSLHQKAALRKVLESWRGKAFTEPELAGFDVKKVLGASCQLQIVHNKSHDGTKTYANVGAIMALPKGIKPLKAENVLKWFSFEETSELPDDTPEWVAKSIAESDEWKANQAAKAGAASPEEQADADGGFADATQVGDSSERLPF